MSFERPLLLLTLLAVPAAAVAYVLAERRRMRYAIRFTNVDVLAGVLKGRLWRQYVPLALFLLAVAALCVGVARPQHRTLVPKDRATVILVVDVSRSMESKDVKPSRIGAATAALWIGTGLWRLLAGTEKPTAYYLSIHVFYGKMALLAAEHGGALEVMRALKAALDPRGLLNPGKLFADRVAVP